MTFAAAYDISVTDSKDTENSCDGDSKPGVNDQASGGGCEPRASSTSPKITPELRAELTVGAAGIPPLWGACMMVHSNRWYNESAKPSPCLQGRRLFLLFLYGLSEKSKFSSFSTGSRGCCVKNARNPQRIPALFALQPRTSCEKYGHFFVFRNASRSVQKTEKQGGRDLRCTRK